MRRLYSCHAIQNLIESALSGGYELKQFRPESLGYGGVALIAPHEGWDNAIIEERYLNEWSSGHTVRRCRKISKRIQKLIAEYEEDYGNE